VRRIPALVLLALLHLPPALAASELSGEVVGVTDGDTLTLLTPDHHQTRVRLADIDTPERGQPYGGRAREALGALAFRRQVRVVVEDTDRYGRSVGRVYAGAADVNAEMVRRGAAWVYPQYNRDPALPGLEAEARAARPLGPARGGAHAALGMAAGPSRGGVSRHPAAGHGSAGRLHLRHQDLLP
jgi:endonuclease YncB( thermonuclease family)